MSYNITFNETKKEVSVLTPMCLIDNVYLIKKYHNKEFPDSKPKHSVRAIMNAEKAIAFHLELAKECKKLLNGKTQFHPLIAPKGTPEKFLANDFIKIGADVIAQKKQIDELEENPKAKKAYNPGYDYLEPLLYFFARSEFSVPVLDQYGKKVDFDRDEFFMPSFKGRLRIGVKWCPSDVKNPVNGGHIFTYLVGVQYKENTDINLMRSEVGFDALEDDADCMFDIPAKKVADDEDTVPWKTNSAAAKGASKIASKRVAKDDVDSHLEEYEEDFK